MAGLNSREPPITAEQLEQCKQDIIDFYKTQLCNIQRDPLDPRSVQDLDSIFTNLQLSKAGRAGTTPVDYRNIYKIQIDGRVAKRILVEGEAGAGKTTLCAKIAWDWIQGKAFQEFHLVLMVPLLGAETKTIGDIVKTYLSETNPVSSGQLDAYVLSNPDKVFLVLDGLDEWGASLSDVCQIMQILLLQWFQTGTVLVTSRPWKASAIRQMGLFLSPDIERAYAFATIDGFTQDNISAYIMAYFRESGTTSGENLIQFVQDNNVIGESMPMYPIFLSMLCNIWKDVEGERKKTLRKLQTFSGLLTEIINFLIEHYLTKNHIGSGQGVSQHRQLIGSTLEKIGQVALNGLVSNQLTFAEDDFEDLQILKIGYKVGFLTQKQSTAATAKFTTEVFFAHKLFQEYTAGLYLCSVMKSNLAEFDNLMISSISLRISEFRFVLYFASAHAQDIAMTLMNYVMQEKAEGDFLVDLAFESHDPSVATGRMVAEKLVMKEGELEIPKSMSPHTVSGYLFIISHCQLPLEKLSVKRSCGRHMSRDLAEAVCTSQSLKTLEIGGVDVLLHEDFYSFLGGSAKQLKLKTLQLVQVDLLDQELASKDLARAICEAPSLTELVLNDSQFHDEFYAALASLATSSKVETMLLQNQRFSPAGYHLLCSAAASSNLAKFLGVTPCLINLTIREVGFHDDFYATMKSLVPTLQGFSASIAVQLSRREKHFESKRIWSEIGRPSNLFKSLEEMKDISLAKGSVAGTSSQFPDQEEAEPMEDQQTAEFSEPRERIAAIDAKTLAKIGFCAKEEESMEALGMALGFSKEDVAKYLTGAPINTRSGHAGTKRLLMEWRDTVPPAEQGAILRYALNKSGLEGLTDECMQVNDQSSASTSAAVSSISDAVVTKLASSLWMDDHIITLGKALGFELVRIQGYLRMNNEPTKGGYSPRRLIGTNVETINEYVILRRAMQHCGLANLAYMYLEESDDSSGIPRGATQITHQKLQQLSDAISDNPKMMTLGLELEFSAADVMRFHSANRRQGKTVSKGTSAMLFTWRDAVRQYVQSELKEKEAVVYAEDGSIKGSVSDEELKAIAEMIKDSPRLLDMGFEFGFPWNDIKHYRATNRANRQLTSVGTLAMLTAWRSEVPAQWQREMLCVALKEAGIPAVAKRHIPDTDHLANISLGTEHRNITAHERTWGMASMLFQWRFGVAGDKQCGVLRDALNGAGLNKLADEYISRRMRLTGLVRDIAISHQYGEATIGERGGELSLDEYHISINIPEGALTGNQRISIRVGEGRSDNVRADSEVPFPFAIECRPAGLKLKKPATISMPFPAYTQIPAKIDLKIQYPVDGKIAHVTPPAKAHPKVILKRLKSMLQVDSLSSWWVSMMIGKHYTAKRALVMPFYRILQHEKFTHSLHVHIYDDFKGMTEMIQTEMKELEFKQVYPPKPFLIHWNHGPATFRICVEETELGRKTIREDDFKRNPRNMVSFEITLTADDPITVHMNQEYKDDMLFFVPLTYH